MTYKDFDQQWKAIDGEKFGGADLNPIHFGIQRAAFEETKLIRMIALADRAKLPTAARKREVWAKRLVRIRTTRERFERLRAEMQPASSGKASRKATVSRQPLLSQRDYRQQA